MHAGCVVFEGKRQLEKPGCVWESDIKMKLKEIRWEGMEWTILADGRNKWQTAVNRLTNIQVP